MSKLASPLDTSEQKPNSYPASPVQREIWLAEQLTPAQTYNIGEYVEIRGPLREDVFARAVACVVRQTTALQRRFVAVPQGLVWRLDALAADEYRLPVVDLGGWAAPLGEARALMRQDMDRARPAEGDDLFGFVLYKIAAAHHVWYFRYHHILVDGYGCALIARRVFETYNRLASEKPPGINKGHDRNGDVGSCASDADRLFWKGCIAATARPAWLSRQPVPHENGFKTLRCDARISRTQYEQLQSVASGANARASCWLMAAAAIVFYSLTRRGDLQFSLPVANRGRSNLHDPATSSNVLPLAVHLSDGATPRKVAAAIAASIDAALPHQRYRGEQIRRDNGLQNTGWFGPTINFMSFNYGEPLLDCRVDITTLRTGPVDDLYISIQDRQDGGDLQVYFEDDARVHTQQQLDDLVALFATVVGAITETPDRPLGSLAEILSDSLDVSLQRSFFGMRQPLHDAAFLRWGRPAHELTNATRALDFGPAARYPLGISKIWLGAHGGLSVRRLTLAEHRSGAPAGTLLAIEDERWHVATASEDVVVEGLITQNGNPVGAREAAALHDLQPGDLLPLLDSERAAAFAYAYAAALGRESTWLERLERLHTLVLPFEVGGVADGPEWQATEWRQLDLSSLSVGGDCTVPVLTALSICLARLCQTSQIQLGWGAASGTSPLPQAFLSSTVPFEVSVDVARHFDDVSACVAAELAWLPDQGGFLRDISLRHARLEAIDGLRSPRPWRIGVALVPALPDASREAIGAVLTLQISPHDGCIRWIFDGALLQAAQIEAIERSLRMLLLASRDPGARASPVGDIDIMPPAERKLLLQDWNHVEPGVAQSLCLHEWFEQHAQRQPEAVALVCGDERVTYAELNTRANRWAHRLIAHGVRPDVLVALCVSRGTAMVVALLAILKAGGAYVPLDPAYPSERLARVLADAHPLLVLTDATGRAALGNHGQTEWKLDAEDCDSSATTAPCTNPDARALGLTPQHLAYVIHTSGSSGTPKGVMVEHAHVTRLFDATRALFDFGPADVGCLFHSIAFDFSVWELWGALRYGARLVIVAHETARSTPLFHRLVCELGVTVLNQTPTAFKSFIYADQHSTLPHRLRLVIFGGEALEPASLAPWYLRHPDTAPRLVNMYGITETTVHVTHHALCRADLQQRGSPIGRRLPDLRLYLLDPRRQPVPLGAVGELYVGGAGVARGYLHQPALTAERFLPDPYSPQPQARMYRTGDLARYRPDGTLLFLGRNDQQVKIRGFRIEIGEIEARLLEHPAVREAVVLALDALPSEPRLIAYVVADAQADAAALRAHLSERLPAYMLPAAFVPIDKLPLTANGKLDRKALPAPPDAAFAHDAYLPPEGEIETTLASLWSELLGVPRVGRHDNFFALGGHSLLAVRLLAQLQQRLGIRLEPVALFKAPELIRFAETVLLSSAKEDGGGPTKVVPRGHRLPPSFAQQRLWLVAQVDDIGSTYHVPLALQLQGDLDRDALRQSLNLLVARHETLRSVFVATESQPHVEFLPLGAAVPLIEHDLRTHPQAQSALANILLEETHAPFDLAAGPPFRARLIQLDVHLHVLLLTAHHIVFDGWSIGVLYRDLAALYAHACDERAPALDPLPIQYQDYAIWQRRRLDGDRLTNHTAYWQRTLADAPALLDLPLARSRPARQSFAGAGVPVTIDAELKRELRLLSARLGVTLFMTLAAAWTVVLGALARQQDLVIGVPAANRGSPEVEGLIGYFVDTLALRIDLSGEINVGQLLARVRDAVLGAQAHQDLPFERVVELAHPPRRLDHTPLFQVMFAWQGDEAPILSLPGVQSSAMAPPFDRVKFDLELSLGENADEIGGSLNFATALFDVDAIERHVGYLLRVLRGMAQNERQAIAKIDLLGGDERDLLLEEWNRTSHDWPEALCVHDLIERQVRRTPDAIALEFEGESLTYAQLDARANRLAQHLRSLGALADTPLAVCLGRGLTIVVALLAVLKSGGAYLPLDPAYPSERLAQVLRDANPRLVIADARGRLALGAPALAERQVIDPDADPLVAASPDDPPGVPVQPRHLAYVIYTSGSTGTPKGVMVEHAQLVNFLHAMRASLGIGADDRLLAVTSISFDIAALELFLPLCAGARVVLASHQDALDPLALQRLLLDHRITLMQATPSTWRGLLATPWQHAPTLTALCGGEAMPPQLATQLATRCKALWNLYGPTETTVWSSAYHVGLDPDAEIASVPIGRPIANTRLYLLDPLGQPVPLGAVGELHIGGHGVARGYFQRPDLTRERFLPDPFAHTPEARMYRTGDLARWRSDGTLLFLGRNDQQVKLRGFRIELGEIEARLREHPAVREAVVLARHDARDEPRLVAYIVPRAANDFEGSPEAIAAPDFSLFYFGAETRATTSRYALYLEAAKFADSHGFKAIWTPERHFHRVGILYPNPAVLNAALATITTRVQLRAGSVVLPLHDPIRVAEEWAVVDNLSNGRAGIAIASGWHARDFALRPENFASRKKVTQDGIRTLQELWRGKEVERRDGNGNEFMLRIFPEPVQPELPLWITAAGNPETFTQAGQLGANLLTHLLGQTIAQLAEQISRYRAARAQAGFDPRTGVVSVMMHTFLGVALDDVRAEAEQPFIQYMLDHLSLMAPLAQELGVDIARMPKKDQEEIAKVAFERYCHEAALIGTPTTCLPIVAELLAAGVDEIASLIDWIDAERALAALPHLNALREIAQTAFNPRRLRRDLATQLPDYMVPAAFVQLQAMPLTPNGKIDHKALPALDDEAFARRVFEPPHAGVEATLAALWSELLGTERVGRQDNFFALGGHSLLAVQLMGRLRRLGLGTHIHHLFAAPTLADLAATLGSEIAQSAPPNAITPQSTELTPDMLPLIDLSAADIARILDQVPGGLNNVQDIYALSPLQDGILFHHLLGERGDPYLLIDQIGFSSRGLLDRYIAAVQSVVDRHDILRTSFVWEGISVPAQVVWRRAQLEVVELALDLKEGPIPEQLARRFSQATHRIDVTRAPLLHFIVAQDESQARWVLLQVFHHLIGDHSSQELIRAEVQAILEGREQALTPAASFRNLIAEARNGVSAQAHERYFRAELADISEPSVAFGIMDVYRDGTLSTEKRALLAGPLNRRLRVQARRLGVSLASLCHLAWGRVVACASGRSSVVFGTVLFGRMHAGADADRSMGLFMNTLPLRLDIDETPLEDAIRRVHDRLADLLRHEHASLALAQRCSGVAAPAPLFNTLLNYRYNAISAAHAAQGPPTLEGIEWLSAEERNNYPITLSVEDFGDGLGLTAQVVAPLDPARVHGYMEQALWSIVEALEGESFEASNRLEIVPPDERKLLLQDWNHVEPGVAQSLCLHEWFEQHAQRQPEAVALVCGDERVTYAELNTRANRWAHRLIAHGVRPDVLVALCVSRGTAMVVALLAILKAGGAYVPLDPAYPSERLARVLADAHPLLVLTDATGRAALGNHGQTEWKLDAEDCDSSATTAPCTNPDARALGLTPQHLAYVIHTSGSSGTPKGVMVEHAHVTRLFDATRALFDFGPADVGCLFHSIAFDFSVWELWGALRYGARLVIVAHETARSTPLFHRLVCELGVTVLNQTPTAFKSFIYADQHSTLPHRLRLVIFGGEALELASLAPWYLRHPDTAPRLVNMYGITETTVHVTHHALCRADLQQRGSPIGRRLPDLRLYLLDPRRQPVPLGAVGELYVGGAGVARGYLHQPALTAERFLPDPYSPQPQARMYRTGDLARYRPDGTLLFLGRNDQQVKIRGFRIELGEIEARLLEHPAVREAVVLALDALPSEPRLIAYVVADAQADAAALRAHLSERLPAYMLPAAFVPIDKLPLTTNGKLDRKALPAPPDAAFAHDTYLPPEGEIETTLASLWSELLGVPRVGRHDNFFALGGHSLLAVRLMEQLRRTGIRVEIRALFTATDLATLARSAVQMEEIRV